MAEVVELGPKTIRAIEQAVYNALSSALPLYSPSNTDVTVSEFDSIARGQLTDALKEALEER